MNLQEAKDKLHKAGQEQVLRYYEELSEEQKEALLKQIEDTDFSILDAVKDGKKEPQKGVITPLAAMQLKEIEEKKTQFRETGLQAIREGKVGAVLLAGGREPGLDPTIRRECLISVLQRRYIFSSVSLKT